MTYPLRYSRPFCVLFASVLLATAVPFAQAQVEKLAEKEFAELADTLAKRLARQSPHEAVYALIKAGALSQADLNKLALERIFSEDKKYFAGSVFATTAKQNFSQLGDDAFRTVVAGGRAADYLIPNDNSVLQLLQSQNAALPPDKRLIMTLTYGKLSVSSPDAWLDAKVDMAALRAQFFGWRSQRY